MLISFPARSPAWPLVAGACAPVQAVDKVQSQEAAAWERAPQSLTGPAGGIAASAGPQETAGGAPAVVPAPFGGKAAGSPKVVVVMPAYNAAKTLEGVVAAIPRDIVDEVILVDDKSSDNTVDLAQSLLVQVIWHPHNVGYGGNQKTCYLQALQNGAQVVVMLHPDGQYEPNLIGDLVKPILDGEADMVIGSRLARPGMAKAGGMPTYKYIANRFLTTIENKVLGTRLSEMHSGYRAYSRRLLLTIPFLRNSLGFSFDSELIMQTVQFGFRIAEVPAFSRYMPEASSIGLKDASVYGLKTLSAAGRLVLHRTGIVKCRKFEL